MKIYFHVYENSINIDKVDVKKIVSSNKESYGNKGSYKYFLGYTHTHTHTHTHTYMKVMSFHHHYT